MKTLRLFFLITNVIFLNLSVVKESRAEIHPVSGDITENTTWQDTIQVTGDVRVMDGYSLTIDPGTYIEFQGHYFLKIYGDMQAVGEEGDSIVFTAKDPLTGWKGIRLNNTMYDGGDFWYALSNNDTTRLSYCRIEYTKSYPAIYLRIFTKLTVRNCFFYRNTDNNTGGNAFWSHQGGGLFTDCHFLENSDNGATGGAMRMTTSNDVHVIRNCSFYGNSSGDGGAIYLSGSPAILENNTFIANEATDNGGAFLITNCDDVVMGNNLIVNNSADFGGGMYLEGSSFDALNNTIANNYASSEGGGIYFDANSDGDYYSNIFWGSETSSVTNQFFIEDDRSDPSFYNCNVQGGTSGVSLSPGIQLAGTYESNIDADPEFVNPSPSPGSGSGSPSYNWELKAVSPCINSGLTEIPGIDIPDLDLNGGRRIAFGDIDMGAYEYYLSEMPAGGTISENTAWVADTVKVGSDVTIIDGVTLTILPGVYVEFQDAWKIDVQGTLIAKGNAENPVIFSVDDTAGFAPGYAHTGWNGIIFDNTSEANAASEIEYAILEYGKNMFGGALYVNNFSKLSVNNTIFRSNFATHSGGAAYLYDAGVTFAGCSFLNNKVYNETSNHEGGGIWGRNSDITISNSIMSGNYSSGGGALYAEEGSVVVIENSHLVNNYTYADPDYCRGGAIASYWFCDILISNSVIANNHSNGTSGGIFFWSGKILGINSLVVNNLADSNYTGGISVVGDSEVSFYNSIIRGNKDKGSNTQLGTNIELYNCNVEQSLSGFDASNINVDPDFIAPTPDAGVDHDALSADWSLGNFSPCINMGVNNVPGPGLPSKDLAGNPRVNLGIVDMGVYEHQGSLPEITYQPDNLILCEGDEAQFRIHTNDTARFQWQKNGVNIPGAESSTLTIVSITMLHQGNYRCIVANAYDTILSNPAYLFVVQLPTILLEPSDTWVGKSGKTELRTYASGNNVSYQWLKDGVSIPGAVLPDYLLSVSNSTEEGGFSCIISNTCHSDTTREVHVYLAPQICMVTVDTATGNNLVVWERKSAGPIQHYNIYRESKYAGIYDLLATVPYDELTVLTDSMADPTVQAYLYKITATDTAGNETDADLCRTHKTIHLLATINPETNSTQLDWDRYVGFDYGTYEIYRSDTTVNFGSIHLMSSSTSTWADADPGTSTKYYRVAAVKPESCMPYNPDPTKAGAGPYQQSLSNLDNNRHQATYRNDRTMEPDVQVFPNPVESFATVRFPNSSYEIYRFSLFDPSGRMVYSKEDISSAQFEFSRHELPPGLYLYELRGPRTYRGKILLK